MNDEQFEKILSERNDFMKDNRIILTMIKSIQDDVKEIKTRLNLMEVMPEFQKSITDNLEQLRKDLEKIVPTN